MVVLLGVGFESTWEVAGVENIQRIDRYTMVHACSQSLILSTSHFTPLPRWNDSWSRNYTQTKARGTSGRKEARRWHHPLHPKGFSEPYTQTLSAKLTTTILLSLSRELTSKRGSLQDNLLARNHEGSADRLYRHFIHSRTCLMITETKCPIVGCSLWDAVGWLGRG